MTTTLVAVLTLPSCNKGSPLANLHSILFPHLRMWRWINIDVSLYVHNCIALMKLHHSYHAYLFMLICERLLLIIGTQKKRKTNEKEKFKSSCGWYLYKECWVKCERKGNDQQRKYVFLWEFVFYWNDLKITNFYSDHILYILPV